MGKLFSSLAFNVFLPGSLQMVLAALRTLVEWKDVSWVWWRTQRSLEWTRRPLQCLGGNVCPVPSV